MNIIGKKLVDDVLVNVKSFDFLQSWCDIDDNKIIMDLYGTSNLCKLTSFQYCYLMKHAMADELKQLES